ncbi:MAG: endopeptidase La [Patescibacteria group bacterium]
MKKKAFVAKSIPVVAVRGSVVFPHTDSLLSFGRPKSINAINAAFDGDRIIAIFTQKDQKITDPDFQDLYEVGTIATVTQMMTTDGEIHAMVRGQARVKIAEIQTSLPYLEASVEEIPEKDLKGDEVTALSKRLVELFKKAINLGKLVEVTTVMQTLSGQIQPIELVDSIASLLDMKTSEKQKLLGMTSVLDRLKKVTEYLSREVNILDIEKTISSKTQKKFEEQMRKAMLREKKKTIEEELGEDEAILSDGEIDEYKKKIKAAKMPKDVLNRTNKELKRLGQLSPNNPEGAYIRNYLDWLVDMPWSISTADNTSIKNASKVLDDQHYGLEKTKDRILEFLAVMQLKNEKNKKKSDMNMDHPTILGFMGPPGVGKTSIGKSIADALGRKFIRISLGGIRDEAEVRGHRRTYVGALPGRIIQGIKTAGTNNPVFMLDEIDKLGTDFRGDPSSALLEALDPEQNKEFSDHYLEVPFDLSKVMFIATGNVLENIPVALKDRMEIIEFAGYTEDAKAQIAKKFLWPKQLKVNGLADKKIKIDDMAINEIISFYTRESGVRNLERNLASVGRKIARLVASKKKYPLQVSKPDIRKFLGPRKFTSLLAEKENEIGMSTGLAVTGAGGEILFIEVSIMPGKGKLILTGQLGEVMKESAKAGLTWARSHWRELGLKEDFGSNVDIHIHIPEGAVPKDGPSAGVSMATALVSALTGIAVKKDVGMTGEVTLRGRVMEIGGVKQKTIAGHRAGLKTIILPKDNKKDMEEVPDKVKKDINFVFAQKLEDVLKIALVSWPVNHTEKVIPTASYIAAA